jgi:hypothetical protein
MGIKTASIGCGNAECSLRLRAPLAFRKAVAVESGSQSHLPEIKAIWLGTVESGFPGFQP